MNISGIKGYSFSNKALTGFKGKNEESQKGEYYNPVNVKTERKLAVLSSAGISLAVGAIAAGLVSVVKGKEPNQKMFEVLFSKVPVLSGLAATLVTLGLTLPSKLYHTKINATVKEKEMGVFTADKELKKDLTKEVHSEVKDPDVSLDQKLQHNMQLQLANKANAVGFTTF